MTNLMVCSMHLVNTPWHTWMNSIEKRNGIWHIDNPVAPGENFADKWELEPEKAQAALQMA